jgi:hypothetical protein
LDWRFLIGLMSSLSPNANMPFTFFVVLVCWSEVLLTSLWHLLQKCSVLTVISYRGWGH